MEQDVIKKSILLYDSNAGIFLFGSRTNDQAKGGDIDILIFSDAISFSNIIKIKSNIFKYIPEQKIDLIVKKPNQNDAFVNCIQEQLISLNG